MKKLVSIFALSLFLPLYSNVKAAEDQSAEIRKLDERLTDLELSSLNNKINFGVDLKVSSAYMIDNSKVKGEDRTFHRGLVGAILFRLNANAEISSNVRVYASAESLSFFNSTFFNNPTNINNRETQDKGEKIVLSKAYFDWRFYKNWLTFSGGRLPTTQGPPEHIKDGVSREGTYPVTAYSIPLDGFALTAKMSTPLEMKDNLSFRFIYKPGGQTQSTTPYRGLSLGDPDHPARMARENRLYSGMIEFEQLNNQHGIWGKMLAILQFGYYKFGSPQSFQTTGLPKALIAQAGAGADYDSYRVYFDNDKLVDAKILSPYLELNKVFGLPLDFYTTMSITKSQSHAKARGLVLTGSLAGTQFDLGPFLHSGEASATRILTGLRYEFADRFFIGTELMRSSEKALPTVFHADASLSPNYLNGKSYEVYLLKNVYNNNFIVRLGYTHIDVNADLTNGLFFRNTEEKIDVASLTFDFRI